MRFVGIIQSRLDSSRLPGKALIDVHGRALIDYVIHRTAAVPGLDELVVATTRRAIDDELVRHVERASVRCFRGDTLDVAKRLLDCAMAHDADYFVRINGDCVFVDPNLIDVGINLCATRHLDFVTNIRFRSFPYGISVEIIRTGAFAEAYEQLSTGYEREHATSCFYRNSLHWKSINIHSGKPIDPRIRLVVDTEEDLANFRKLVYALGDSAINASYASIVSSYLSLNESNL